MLNSLFSKTKRRLLALLLLSPDRKFYLIEIARLTGISQGTLHREIKPLVRDGILQSEKRANQTFYSVNRSNPIYPELRGIVYKTFGISDVLISALKPLKKKIKVAFVYGSIAKGEETAGSDIDLFVMGQIEFGDLSIALSKTEKALGREINPFTISPKEFNAKLKAKNHFITSMLKSPKIMLIGSEDDIRRLGQ